MSSDETTKHFSEKEGWELCAHHLSSDSVIEKRWGFDKTFHNTANKQQLSRHVKQTVEYIDPFSPTTIIFKNFTTHTNCPECQTESPSCSIIF